MRRYPFLVVHCREVAKDQYYDTTLWLQTILVERNLGVELTIRWNNTYRVRKRCKVSERKQSWE